MNRLGKSSVIDLLTSLSQTIEVPPRHRMKLLHLIWATFLFICLCSEHEKNERIDIHYLLEQPNPMDRKIESMMAIKVMELVCVLASACLVGIFQRQLNSFCSQDVAENHHKEEAVPKMTFVLHTVLMIINVAACNLFAYSPNGMLLGSSGIYHMFTAFDTALVALTKMLEFIKICLNLVVYGEQLCVANRPVNVLDTTYGTWNLALTGIQTFSLLFGLATLFIFYKK